jgi:periplasmic protein CpxP/Spy
MSTAVKRTIIGLILVTGIAFMHSPLIQAQQKRMSVEDRVKILNTKLKLSDEQSAKITQILEDQREEMTTAMGENRDDRKARRSAIQEVMKKTNDKIKAVLTEDQAAQYDKMFKKRP